jgi:hypothetical protein
MSDTKPGIDMHYLASEAVGVFPDASSLNEAVTQLGIAGFDRASISVLGIDAKHPGQDAGPHGTASEIADDPAAKLTAFVSQGSRDAAQSMTIAIPLEIGASGAAWAVAAAGSAMLVAISATVVGGVVGAGLGALLYYTVARRHAAAIQSQLATGGLILWVNTPDKSAEARALGVLTSCGGAFVHVHCIERTWGVANIPLHGVQPDPFLEHDPSHAST